MSKGTGKERKGKTYIKAMFGPQKLLKSQRHDIFEPQILLKTQRHNIFGPQKYY